MRRSSQSKVLAMILGGNKPRNHWRRYVLGAMLSVCGFLAVSAAYMVFAPVRYTSEWAIILPGSGVSAKVALDRIGQTQMSASSPFSEKSLSPRVNYKEIATSRPVLMAAADAVGLDLDSFGKPRIKLIDQTSIIRFKISAQTPEDAQKRSWALFKALRAKLDKLRSDEIKRRQASIRESVGEFEANLKAARGRLLSLQVESGLASLEQYNQLVNSIELLRRELTTAKATRAESKSQVSSLTKELGVDAQNAVSILAIVADQEFQSLWQAYATANATYAENLTRFGARHPRVADPKSKMLSIESVLQRKLAERNMTNQSARLSRFLSAQGDQYVELLTGLVKRFAEMQAQDARIAEIEGLLDKQEARRKKLGVVAARLDDLQRDHQIANAVFSSAVARIDTSTSDIYASYPLLQVLDPPTLPDSPSSPNILIAALAAVGGSGLAIAGWLFAWLHQWFASVHLGRARIEPQMAQAAPI
ncbi:MAG: hypothetical protein AAF346_15315 [Pseudomonadota bacterium]